MFQKHRNSISSTNRVSLTSLHGVACGNPVFSLSTSLRSIHRKWADYYLYITRSVFRRGPEHEEYHEPTNESYDLRVVALWTAAADVKRSGVSFEAVLFFMFNGERRPGCLRDKRFWNLRPLPLRYTRGLTWKLAASILLVFYCIARAKGTYWETFVTIATKWNRVRGSFTLRRVEHSPAWFCLVFGVMRHRNLSSINS